MIENIPQIVCAVVLSLNRVYHSEPKRCDGISVENQMKNIFFNNCCTLEMILIVICLPFDSLCREVKNDDQVKYPVKMTQQLPKMCEVVMRQKQKQ